ncbi:hypothetical protein [Lysobacter sp. CA199]|uniref:hypothetical protein n=1 Tax=Lysobacter sp. CA199 TaxID=3455608 RepID=UPI003F8D0746
MSDTLTQHHDGEDSIRFRLASSPKEAFMGSQHGDRTMNPNDTNRPDPLLASLPDPLLTLVEDQLSNNESAGDEELRSYFIACGLTTEQADRAVQYRPAYATDIYWGNATPIRTGVGLRYNPRSGWLEPA